MHRLLHTSKYVISVCCLGACRDASGPARPTPATLEVIAAPASSARIGSSAGAFTVRVSDVNGTPLSGVVVTFVVSSGAAHVSPRTDTTSTAGIASTTVILGTTPGGNEISATVTGLTPLKVSTTAI